MRKVWSQLIIVLIGVIILTPVSWAEGHETAIEVLVKCYQPQLLDRSDHRTIEAGDYFVIVYKDSQGTVVLKEGLAYRPDQLRSPFTSLLEEAAGETYFKGEPDEFFHGGNRIDLRWSYSNRSSFILMTDFEHGHGTSPFSRPICFAWDSVSN